MLIYVAGGRILKPFLITRVCGHALFEAALISPLALLGGRQVGRPGSNQTTQASLLEVTTA